jgi:hypothetical protein
VARRRRSLDRSVSIRAAGRAQEPKPASEVMGACRDRFGRAS